MKWQNSGILFGSIAAIFVTIFLPGEKAEAATLHNGWNYSIDAFLDACGGTDYDIKGLAIKETDNNIFVGLTAEIDLVGHGDGGAQDGNIGWGDLFFNFSGESFQTASNTENLLGVHFSKTNDSQVVQTGVYKNVRATSVALENAGYGNLVDYYKTFDANNTLGSDLSTKKDVYTYLYGTSIADYPDKTNTPVLNVIDSGTWLGGIDLLNDTQLREAGLDFGYFSASGSKTFGFKFDRALLPQQGDFISHLFLECGNDAVAIKSKLKKNVPEQMKNVPEPSGVLGLGVVALAWMSRQLSRRDKTSK